jgi:galactokinase
MGVRKREDSQARVYSVDYDEECSLDMDKPIEKGASAWFEYIKGCIWTLREAGKNLVGFDAGLLGDIPQGAGLSSSAAREVTTVLALDETGHCGLSKVEIAKLAQRAENDWVGMKCGIMDQMICVIGEAGKAFLIDCNDLKYSAFKIPESMVVAIMDTGARHALRDSAYNERREQCEAACKILGVSQLRNATPEMLENHRETMPEVIFRRAYHILFENLRTRAAGAALQYEEIDIFGTLMNESHYSLQYSYEVSCPELDRICEVARSHSACLGARMTGGGFGGSAVAFLYAAQAREFADYVTENYFKRTGKSARVYISRSTDGGRVEKTDWTR